jgi:sugar/nucleoside kinase (ribokinase family)
VTGSPCVALKVVCLARDRESLLALKRAAVGSEWELTPGATSLGDAMEQLREFQAHVLVVHGVDGDVVARVRQAHPGVRIVLVASATGAGDADPLTVSVQSVEGVRRAILPRGSSA